MIAQARNHAPPPLPTVTVTDLDATLSRSSPREQIATSGTDSNVGRAFRSTSRVKYRSTPLKKFHGPNPARGAHDSETEERSATKRLHMADAIEVESGGVQLTPSSICLDSEAADVGFRERLDRG